MVVRTHVGSLTELSTTLRLSRSDHGLDPATLGRADILAFLTRLGHLEQTEAISPNRRLQIVRHVRTVLRDARDLGMTRAGGCAAGLPGEFSIRVDHVPSPVHVDGPGRALPNEVMNALNDALPLLQRRLPIPDSTAALIRGQQDAVRYSFPHTAPADRVLLPAATANPDGTKPLRARVLTGLHRDWVGQLPEFTLSDGGVFPDSAVVAYAYRHTYAQRHADAGTPIDVLRELIGHRSVHCTEARGGLP